MALQPLNDRVILKRIEDYWREESPIVHLSETREESKYKVDRGKLFTGSVLAVGSGEVTKKGNRLPMPVCEGDIVLAWRYPIVEIRHDGQELWAVREGDIIAKLE
jgi:chaperonin GroES